VGHYRNSGGKLSDDAISQAFSPFGNAVSIGQGVDGTTGAVSLDGEVISLLVRTQSGEFLIACFNGQFFELHTETGLESLHSLHLADADQITGSRVGSSKLSISPGDAPACDILTDGSGGLWVRFRRLPGLGSVQSSDCTSNSLGTCRLLPLAVGMIVFFEADQPLISRQPVRSYRS
jgi:hypothetical protein